jgi:PhnB protein
LTAEIHPPVISVMLADPLPRRPHGGTHRYSAPPNCGTLGGVVGLTVAGAPFFLGEPENNGWDTPAALGSRTVRVEVFVDDPDIFIERAVTAGADGSVDKIRDHQAPWGVHRQGGFIDPFGHLWLVGDRSPPWTHTTCCNAATWPRRGRCACTSLGPLVPPREPASSTGRPVHDHVTKYGCPTSSGEVVWNAPPYTRKRAASFQEESRRHETAGLLHLRSSECIKVSATRGA